MRNICNNQALMKLTYTNVGLQMLCYKLACICVLKVTNQPKGKRKHRPKESTEVKPVLAPVKIYDSSCLLPIQKELGKNYMWDLLKWWCFFFRVEIQYFSTLQCMFLAHYLAQYFVCNLFLELIVQTFRQCAVIMRKLPVQ